MTDSAPRPITIEWNERGPMLEKLTGTEARSILREALIRERESRTLAGQLINVIVALVHRDASRGIVGADGQPALPMQAALPEASTKAAAGNKWTVRCEAGPEGFVVVVDLQAPTPVEPLAFGAIA